MPAGTSTAPKRRSGSWVLVLLSVILGLLLIVAGIYAGIAKRYEEMFLPGSTINGIDVSGMTVSQAERALEDSQDSYTLTLIERDSVTETITGEEIDLALNLGNEVDDLLAEQNSWTWPMALLGYRTFTMTVDEMFSYDTAKLTEAITSLRCMDSSASTAPKDAYLSNYDAELGGVTIVEEVEGNLVDQDILLSAIVEAVGSLQTELDLEEIGCYVEPSVTSDDPTLIAKAQALNEYLGIVITYQMGDDTLTIDGSTLQNWLTFNDDGTVTLDESQVTTWVSNLRYNYATIFSNREFTTSYGETITVTGGDYGWWMDDDTTAQELIEAIENRQSGSMEPVWYQEAAVLGEGASGDFGNTYVEINLTAQHLYFYKDGELIIESDVVTGKNDATPTGTYSMTYKERYGTLVGENYSSPVSYWMPFSGNVGLHDASWRTSFGGTIYKTSGSHGCVNLPIETAKTIYENITDTCAIILYKLDGTESSTTSSQSYEEIAAAVVDAIDEIEAAGDITSSNYNVMSKRIEWAQAAYSSLSSSAKALVTNYSKLSAAVSALATYEASH
ncbi:MAG: L,D-transpeptidase/peptidoglycan binding protein [Clostridiales bacterium]|nr:L,D-transpeptidase/peptidoglycan binding protein [Clostridiales bacterium]